MSKLRKPKRLNKCKLCKDCAFKNSPKSKECMACIMSGKQCNYITASWSDVIKHEE